MKSDTLIKFCWLVMLKQNNFDCDKALKLLSAKISGFYSASQANTIMVIEANNEKDCWLINPVDFIMSGSSVNEKCVYLHLATKRNWMEYAEHGTTKLPIYVAEQYYTIDSLKSSSLLIIDDENIDFRY